MWAVSQAFLAAHRAPSQTVTLRAELWSAGARAATLQVASGSVSVDARRATRRTVTCDLVDPTGDLVPHAATDLLVPTGTQLRLWRGITLPTGTVEEVPLGVFRLTDPKITLDDSGAVKISLTGSDESDTVRAARLTTAWTWAAGTPVGQAILALLADRHPTLPTRDDTSASVTIGATTVTAAGAESDPWKAACDVAAQFGVELIIDAAGTAVVRAIPNPTVPVVTYARGADAVITSLSRTLSAETTYSGVVVASETSDTSGGTPIQAIAWDTNPASPTYYLGPFGKRPYFITSQMITTLAQASATAAAHLPTVTGILDRVEWEQVTNPALDAGDLVALTDPAIGVDAMLTIEALTIPLGSGGMTAVTRSRNLT